MYSFDMFNDEDLVALCIRIINSEIQQGEEIKVLSPFGAQNWRVVELDDQSTIGWYEAYITFQTPNGVLEVHGYIPKYENEDFVTITIDGLEIDEKTFMWYDLS